jgi:hypothetical protein
MQRVSTTSFQSMQPDCITTGCDWESHRAAHNRPNVVRVYAGLGRQPECEVQAMGSGVAAGWTGRC